MKYLSCLSIALLIAISSLTYADVWSDPYNAVPYDKSHFRKLAQHMKPSEFEPVLAKCLGSTYENNEYEKAQCFVETLYVAANQFFDAGYSYAKTVHLILTEERYSYYGGQMTGDSILLLSLPLKYEDLRIELIDQAIVLPESIAIIESLMH